MPLVPRPSALPAPEGDGQIGAGLPPAGRVPQRTCIGCRRQAAATELERVARSPDGSLDLGRTLPGRGAWLCAGSSTCFDLAVGRRGFSRALRAEVSAEAIASLRNDFVRLPPAVRG